MPAPPEFLDDFETPIYAYDALEVEARCAELKDLTPEGSQIFFLAQGQPAARPWKDHRRLRLSAARSLPRANSLPPVQAGFPLDRTLFGAPEKPTFEIEQALKKGVRFFSVESANEVLHACRNRAAAFRTRLKSCLRLNPVRRWQRPPRDERHGVTVRHSGRSDRRRASD